MPRHVILVTGSEKTQHICHVCNFIYGRFIDLGLLATRTLRVCLTKIQLTSSDAIEAYKKALKTTLIYKKSGTYCRVRNLCWCFDQSECIIKSCICTQIVSRHVLGGIIQSPAANLSAKEHSLWIQNICYENESTVQL